MMRLSREILVYAEIEGFASRPLQFLSDELISASTPSSPFIYVIFLRPVTPPRPVCYNKAAQKSMIVIFSGLPGKVHSLQL